MPPLRADKLSGTDIVAEVVRLCAMNLYLHGIGGATSPVTQKDALLDRGDKALDVILTNPPFGKRQSFRIVRETPEIAAEIVDSLETALRKFRLVAAKLGAVPVEPISQSPSAPPSG